MRLNQEIFAKSNDVSAVCTYGDTLPTIDFDALIKSIVDAFPNQRFGEKFPQSVAGEFLHFNIGTCYVKIEMIAQKRADVHFQKALLSPFNRAMAVDFDGLVKAHKTHIFIRVGTGTGAASPQEDVPDDVLAMLKSIDQGNKSGGKETPENYIFRLNLLLKLVGFINVASPPGLVHWEEADHLLTSTGFQSAVRESFPIFLFTHPYLMSGTDEKTGQKFLGADFLNSERFIGKRLIFEPSPLSLKSMLELSLMFIQYSRQLGTIPKHGESFGRSAEEIISVYHIEPSEEHPFGSVHLRAVKHAELPTDYVPAAMPTRMTKEEAAPMTTPPEPMVNTAMPNMNIADTNPTPKYPDFERAEQELVDIFRHNGDGKSVPASAEQTAIQPSSDAVEKPRKAGFLSKLFAKKEKPQKELKELKPNKGIMAKVQKYLVYLLLLMAAVLAYLMLPQLLG